MAGRLSGGTARGRVHLADVFPSGRFKRQRNDSACAGRPAGWFRHARRRRLHQRPRRLRPGPPLAALAGRGDRLHGLRDDRRVRDEARPVKNLSAFGAGLLFGIGLWLSGMANPKKILDFLDVTGNWDPSLLLVMAGAVTVTLIGFRPFKGKISIDKTKVDAPLVIGSAIFGIGWGIGGYCPGPAVTALASL